MHVLCNKERIAQWPLQSSKVTDFDTIRKRVSDFLNEQQQL